MVELKKVGFWLRNGRLSGGFVGCESAIRPAACRWGVHRDSRTGFGHLVLMEDRVPLMKMGPAWLL